MNATTSRNRWMALSAALLAASSAGAQGFQEMWGSPDTSVPPEASTADTLGPPPSLQTRLQFAPWEDDGTSAAFQGYQRRAARRAVAEPEAAPKPAPAPEPEPEPEPAPEPEVILEPEPEVIPEPAPAPGDSDVPSPEQVLQRLGVPVEQAEPSSGVSLRDSLVQALQNAPDLEVSRLSPAIGEAALEQQRAAWDTRLEGSTSINDSSQPATSNVDRVATRDNTNVEGEVRVVQPNATGGELSAGWTQGRAATNSARVFRNPTYTTAFQVRYAQPLLRGGGRRFTRRGVNLAEVDLRVRQWNLRQDVLDTLGDTERAYWNLAAAREQVHVAQLNLKEAETLLERSRYRVEAGTLAGVALLEAEAAVAERRDTLLVAERNAQVAHNALVALVSPPPRPGFRLPELADPPGTSLPEVPSTEAMISQALGNSPEYRAAIADLDSQKIELAFSEDALQPRIDLVASMTANGVESATTRAISDAGSLDFPSYFVGIEFALPLGRRAARAQVRRRSLEMEQALRRVKALEMNLEGRVLDLIQRYRTDTQRLEVSRRRVEAARAKVDAEEQRFLSGLLNADDILRFQNELATARGSEISARAQASISAMEIWLAAGTLLGRRGITLDEAQFALASDR